MIKAIEISNYGGPEVLHSSDKTLKKIGPEDVLIKHTAIGVNHHDLLFRSGKIKSKNLPLTPGFEAVGIVEQIGEAVKSDYEIGQRVAYATGPLGAYAEKRVINSNFVVAIPDKLGDEEAAASLFKGLTAHYLLRRAYFVMEGNYILITGATGGVGTFLCQWAHYLKANIIGIVGNDNKIEQAKKLGCQHVFSITQDNLSDQIMQITNGKGVNAVYDLVGQNCFDLCLRSLGRFGIYLAVGSASGKIPDVNLKQFARQSFYFSAPSLFSYKANRMELVLSAEEVFQMVLGGKLRVPFKEYNFEQFADAHIALESRKTFGSNIIKL